MCARVSVLCACACAVLTLQAKCKGVRSIMSRESNSLNCASRRSTAADVTTANADYLQRRAGY